MYFYSYHGLFFNGAIHWLVFPRHGIDRAIIVFDLIEKQLSEISIPAGDFKNILVGDLIIMGGCLSVWYRSVHKTQVWLMKEYKVQSSWTMFEIPARRLSPLCFAKGGELVAFNGTGLMKFNDKGELLEISDHMIWRKPAFYTESLLSLPGDCCGNMETQPTKTDKKRIRESNVLHSF
ncbi:F-box/kelch-repeat protein At3g06240-like [Gastrolobium bilobum]|uniref:F-box/kelch-repeat protein At3g06240-like n=1 Tax=Gastrolobium bilobum TaxID=150636 RepID=UPI002AAF7214|nr:F-box/kelch-repeat protein At3g06240-like [Gastrolobium bilobum]